MSSLSCPSANQRTTTLQGLINTIIKDNLRKFVLVLFNDIHVYSANLDEHVGHREVVMLPLRKNELDANKASAVSVVQALGIWATFSRVQGLPPIQTRWLQSRSGMCRRKQNS